MTQNGIVLAASVSILRDNNVLMIKENKPTAQNKWNFPSGRIENGEDILAAAIREVKEETGFEVNLTKASGIYHFTSSSNDQVILFHFTAEIIGGSLNLAEAEITESRWVQLSKIKSFEDDQLRHAFVIKQIADALLGKKLYPLEMFRMC